ncbi:MAG: hypothetical protein JEZ07_01560 [Phycisphaerae bacterium]|nr:hypothetical protein [Phycisphaerae bacterium]
MYKQIIISMLIIFSFNVTLCRALDATVDLEAEIENQYRTFQQDIKDIRRFDSFKDETFNSASLVFANDRDPLDIIVRRSRSLLDDIIKMDNIQNISDIANQLKELELQARGIDVKDVQKRREIFGRAFMLRRKIAFSNPLLDFDKLLFIKRHRPLPEPDHMCDQFYGRNAVAGGGVFVLSDPFSDNAKEINLLEDVNVESGRLKGTQLNKGSFLSPELSYDGKTIFFAYVECDGDRGHITHLDHAENGHWNRGRCYHIFSAQINSASINDIEISQLHQLTDGTFNDFDPCLLPNGRLAFISERRGGYLRCGRECPSYTVFDMKPDGTDIRVLSPHENNEWQPSVTHDGMILYTRWDYVDRHGCTAHHPWIMTPDGRDSRAMHGNFSTKAKRADMEMDLRAIPDSHKIIGTAAPHHGMAYGSIIMFDPRIADDDALAPVKRVTPDVGFPESQGGRWVYGTPWPLNENYYLCVYDAKMRAGSIAHSDRSRNGKEYSIYLLDAFGNKELIWRDPEIACLSPMPLRARTQPPQVPARSQRLAEKPPANGTMAVINVYDSLLPWPEGTKIKALRIYQIFPCSGPSAANLLPHETGRRITEAGDSINLARRILGTVPVEADGSAYFTVPALKEIYFQALDEDGLAVQSMRSATWVQPGESLTCYGCHEPKYRAVAQPKKMPIALSRTPSVPTPDVDGTNTFSYPRLVQPVLDRKCVSCHEKNFAKGAPPLDSKIVKSKALRGTEVYRSYDSLINYAFYTYGDQYRTTPGRFGANASKLYPMLKKGHNDVKLTDAEMYRITVWLDSLSNFYGVYEKDGAQAQLRQEIAMPTLE